MSVSESIQVLLAINEQGATEARAKIQGVEKALNSLQNSQRSGGAPSGSLVGRLQSGLAEQKAALQSELTARSAVADKASLVASAEGRRAAQEKLSIELQAKAAAASSAAARKAAEIEYLSLLAKQKANLLDIANIKAKQTGVNPFISKARVEDATRELVNSKSLLAIKQGERAEQLKAAQLYANQAQISKELVAELGLEVKAAQAALSIEQQRVVAAQQLELAARKVVDDLKAQIAAQPKEWTGALFKERVGQFNSRALPPGTTRPTKGSREQYFPADSAGRTYTPSNANLLYVDDWIAAGKQAEAQLGKTGKTGSTAMKQTGAATKDASASMRNMFIATRSVGSVLAGTSFQGGLYYLSQVGRTMTGNAQILSVFAVGLAAVAYGFASLVREGSKIEGISIAFENLTKNAGIAGRGLATQLQAAARGTVTISESMVASNRALMANGAQLAVELPRLMEIARVSAIATGKDVSYTFDSLVKGIVRGSPRLIDNADIYLKLGDANSIYAKEIGKTVTQLSAQEKQVATLNEVLRQGEISASKMGLSAKTSAENIKSLTTSIRDLIQAAGEKVSRGGVTEFIGNLAEELSGMSTLSRSSEALDTLLEQYKRLYDYGFGIGKQQPQIVLDFMRERDAALAKLESDPVAIGGISAESQLEVAALLEEIIKKYKLLLDAEEAAKNVGDVGWAQRQTNLDKLKASTDGEITALEEFTNAWAAAAEGAKTPMQAQAEALFGTLEDLSALVSDLKMPEMGKTAMLTDVSAWYEWLDVLKATLPAGEQVSNQFAILIDQLAESNVTALMQAYGMTSARDALVFLAEKAYGAGAGIEDLVSNLEDMPAALRSAISSIGLFGVVLDDLYTASQRQLTLDVNIDRAKAAFADLDSVTLELLDHMSVADVASYNKQAASGLARDLAKYERDSTKMTRIEQEAQLKIIRDKWVGSGEAMNEYFDSADSRAKQSAKDQKRSADEVRSAIEAALMKGREVTEADMLATSAGTYKNKALESARRLDAIAERGFKELKAHPDWAGILGIPPEIMGGTEDQLKAWAAQTSEDVDNLLRPDLIDWDAFIANYKKGLQDEATKELTLDIALGKLKTAGLLEGKTDKEARDEVLKMLGLAEPEVTFASYFNDATTDDPMVASVAEFLRTGKIKDVEYNVKLNQSNGVSNTDSYKLSTTTGEERAALVDDKVPSVGKDIAGTQTTDVMLGAMNQAGKDIAGAMYASFDAAIKAQTPGLKVATYWGLDFAANIGMFESVGTNAGNAVGTAFVKAVETKTGKVRETLARAVAGELLPELDRRYVRKGTPD